MSPSRRSRQGAAARATSRSPRPPLARTLGALVLLALVPAIARAQGGTVAGVVTAAGSNEPLASAQVVVVGTTRGAATDAQGRFRLGGLDGGTGATVELEARRIGYQPSRVSARVGDQNVRFVLAARPASLEAVVVTGTAGAVQRRELGNSIPQINAAQIMEGAPIVNMQSLLNGRAAGLVVLPTSGMVGSGQQIRIRGTSSFSLGNNPLIYVDGVRVNNEAASGPINQGFGSRSISRLNDINPADIESIEILKGPSAATLYGTEASNGVINIITKKGTSGAARWSATLRQGTNYVQNWRDRFETNYGRRRLPDAACGTPPCMGDTTTLDLDSLVAGNQGEEIFRTGRHQESELAVSGGSDRVTYYVSGNLLDSKGVDPNNGTRRYTGRANLGLTPTQRLRIATNVAYATGRTDLACEGGCGGRVWSTLLGTPSNYNNPRRHGFHSLLPYQYDQVYTYWQDLDRITGSVTLEHTPLSWLTHRLNLGLDRANEGNNRLFYRVDSLVYTVGSEALGYRETNDRATTYRSVDYAATATYNPTATLRLTTSAGAQYYQNATDYLTASGSVFPTPGLTTIQATTTGRDNDQDYSEDKTLGFYLQEQVGWRDRLFVTAAVRSDDNSAFGANFNRVIYPKFSLSYVLSEEPWFRVPFVADYLQSFRVRAAYGEAGKAPTTYASLRTYAPVSGPGDSPAVTPRFIGNPDLGPERGKEYELGFDAAALQDRLSLEFTYYNKKTTDAILDRQIAPSVGFSGSQPFNAGSIRNTGTELMVRATPVRMDRVSWDLTFNLGTNSNTVLSLYDGVSFVNAGSFTRHTIGYPAFGFWEKHVVSAGAPGANGLIARNTVRCDDGRGGTQICSGADTTFGTADDAPSVYLGRSIPGTEGSLSTDITLFGRWRISSFFDFKRDYKKIDGNTRVRCVSAVIGGRCRENYYPNEFNAVRVAQFQSQGGNLVDVLITNASFTKWRELSIAYDIPERFARRAYVSRAAISVAGRNLKTWTNFPGFEPEAMWLGGTRGGNVAWEQTMLPQLTSWIVSLNLGF